MHSAFFLCHAFTQHTKSNWSADLSPISTLINRRLISRFACWLTGLAEGNVLWAVLLRFTPYLPTSWYWIHHFDQATFKSSETATSIAQSLAAILGSPNDFINQIISDLFKSRKNFKVMDRCNLMCNRISKANNFIGSIKILLWVQQKYTHLSPCC